MTEMLQSCHIYNYQIILIYEFKSLLCHSFISIKFINNINLLVSYCVILW